MLQYNKTHNIFILTTDKPTPNKKKIDNTKEIQQILF